MCELQYDQDDGTTPDCRSPGAPQCPAGRRWAETELPDDNTMDPLAIEYAARGIRVVRLTAAEAAEAVRRMVKREPEIEPQEAARRLGITIRQLQPIVVAAGFELSCEIGTTTPVPWRIVAVGAA